MKRERQLILIEKKKEQEHKKRIRGKRYKTDAEIKEELLMEAKRILGLA